MGESATFRLKTSQIAERQYGHVTRRQLLALGIPASTVGAWVRDRQLLPVHAGVYALRYRRVEPVARALAAVLAAGPRAVLSHDSALALWALRRWPPVPELTVTGDRRPRGITVHRSRTLTDGEVTVELGVPVTRVARALRDMGRRLTPRQRTRLTNDARLRHILTAEEAFGLLHHHRRATRSGGEDDLQRWLERHGFPESVTGAIIAGHEVDVHFPEQRVILELDDFATHGDPATFASDRERDTAHAALGIRTVRLVRGRLTDAEAARLRRILDA